ncbi:NAD(P)/FAD-dependent oxidoreductase [Methanogenium sp. S4BF]|uniref:NAD(P)/FAD-dependent oxidoreductase n=1 Tax=Methanogenium sp. S4BF TaxID=1789226 RepID=UPI00241702F0|nr:NAD(P)/FAD-dependent oxidoreductase [Methanogenium sp. S4BF]WFN34459.1 NAD(P)/FAD-dependent oxidoreductase [Methanogenium sp. S4BF]
MTSEDSAKGIDSAGTDRLYTAIIIGGGPAGLFCACRAAGNNRRILVLEKMPSCGRKLCITGAGRCNLTHTGSMAEFTAHYGDGGKFLRPALMNFTNSDLLAFFKDRGLFFTPDENGKYFPTDGTAKDVLSILLAECDRAGVKVRCGEPVRAIDHKDGLFSVRTGDAVYIAEHVVLAAGGASYPATGSTGDGYTLAGMLGLPVTETGPALAAIIIRDYPFRDLTGISFDGVPLSLYRENKKIREVTGDIILTVNGFSGPGALHISRYVRPGDSLHVGFIAATGQDHARKELTDAITDGKNRQVKTVLTEKGIPVRFLLRMLELSGIPRDATCAHLTKPNRNTLIRHLTDFPSTVAGTEGYATAMATRGGVARDAIRQKTMEAKTVPGLFCIGEVTDIDGDTGGYNLQAAFSTAALAADAIASKKTGRNT